MTITQIKLEIRAEVAKRKPNPGKVDELFKKFMDTKAKQARRKR